MSSPLLISVPNISEGHSAEVVEAVGAALVGATVSTALLDAHTDPDHGRSVLTFAARQGELAAALVACAREAARRIDISAHRGLHPHVGALDVAPVVYLDDARRGAACAEALTAAALIADEVGLPVFLYGELATDPANRERAFLRAGGLGRLKERVAAGELEPDYGPPQLHSTAGCVLVTARSPLIAFNFNLRSPDAELAREIAASLRESSGGFAGVRAIGLYLPRRGLAQVSLNVHDYQTAPLAEIAEVVRARAEIVEAELVGLAPRAALEGFPADVPIAGFCARKHLLENALGCVE